ncbi:MAG TPA: hypothetical protein VJ694_00120 [Patescibacteria group bacterium]|nr:hypothetical protein [Patescibacteria group bacterium]
MLALPPIVLLLPYAVFLLGYVFFSFANVISLGKYGARNAVGLMASFVFVCGTAVIVFMTWQSLATVDWLTAVPLAAVPTPSF